LDPLAGDRPESDYLSPNKFGGMVLSTGNKSEMAVGYCTLYGDMSGGLAVLADVPKVMVYELARWMNRAGEVIPERTVTRAPTAELKPDILRSIAGLRRSRRGALPLTQCAASSAASSATSTSASTSRRPWA
jgi:hypothetical protein